MERIEGKCRLTLRGKQKQIMWNFSLVIIKKKSKIVTTHEEVKIVLKHIK